MDKKEWIINIKTKREARVGEQVKVGGTITTMKRKGLVRVILPVGITNYEKK